MLIEKRQPFVKKQLLPDSSTPQFSQANPSPFPCTFCTPAPASAVQVGGKVTLECGGSAEHLIRRRDEAAGRALTLQTGGDGSGTLARVYSEA